MRQTAKRQRAETATVQCTPAAAAFGSTMATTPVVRRAAPRRLPLFDGLFVAGPSGGNYYAAVAYCTSIGREIAVIRSAEENELARAACGGSSCWIGLVEEGGDGHVAGQSGVEVAGRQ